MSGTVTGVHRFVGRDGLRSTEFVPVLGDDQRRVVIVARHEQPLAGDLVLGASLRRRGGVADAPNGSKTATNATAATILVLIGSRLSND